MPRLRRSSLSRGCSCRPRDAGCFRAFALSRLSAAASASCSVCSTAQQRILVRPDHRAPITLSPPLHPTALVLRYRSPRRSQPRRHQRRPHSLLEEIFHVHLFACPCLSARRAAARARGGFLTRLARTTEPTLLSARFVELDYLSAAPRTAKRVQWHRLRSRVLSGNPAPQQRRRRD